MRQVSYRPLFSGGGSDIKVKLHVQKIELLADEVHVVGRAAVPGHVYHPSLVTWRPSYLREHLGCAAQFGSK